MKKFEEFTQEEKLSILGGKSGGSSLLEDDCFGIFGGGCKEGCKPVCKDGCKESSKTTITDPTTGGGKTVLEPSKP